MLITLVLIKSNKIKCKYVQEFYYFMYYTSNVLLSTLGMTVHMNGFAMYYPMVTLFVAQMHGLEIGFPQIIILWYSI